MTDHSRRVKDRDAIDPAPDTTPTLEPGGGVNPGDTPPDTAQTSGLSHPQRLLSKRFPGAGVATLVAIGCLIVAMLVVAVGLVVMVIV
ncbi:hypothetical protein Gbro_4334 [Gordonia bronchialis DSM 43247]|uniref:Uncharacterized protein n=1 Tax=Gordonia bronchialis (strain ATCC 25592 / DSM 43247 / BCRC 13721 / JCM 3198 / KCTC 3076 / NBRC 16047 / NCTC 10667) TaxID=526226 RepID=D0L5Z0_GORB4|nr:DUF6480 family protein [Gordonia bronchialis]ACY23476.1 hypothetical protein Gbro_4334 [Gordonia bronchialis DSM 43247]MCC3321647.1 DUF6480 family protein [Gordonia bronchialis]QGS23157.1 hypothetical protein FOB84_02130 [Gordonia bronchialis]UAK36549.1 DUF6480 family protein [Gordonia bronchialis]STQ66474.1 Uncharacterised protein [Gordonia bronchialis]